jgi:hypothetical protein
MYFGEGAGVRRRLISASVQAKIDRDPTYAKAFHTALAEQDMAEHAEKARKERRRKDVSQTLSKDAKNLAKGNYGNMQTGVLVLVVGGYLAHQSGLDKKILEKGRYFYGQAKERFTIWRYKNAPINVYNFHQVNNEKNEKEA